MKRSSTLLFSLLVALLCFGITQQSYAKVYASYVRVTQDSSLTAPFDGNFADRSGAAIRFFLNQNADSVVVNVVPTGGGAAAKTYRVVNAPQGDNTIMWNGSSNTAGVPVAAGSYRIQVIAYHQGFPAYTEISYVTSVNPFIFTRGHGIVTNPALRWYGFQYAGSGGGYAAGLARHASWGKIWGNSPDTALLTTTGFPIGGAAADERRYSTTIDQDGFAYVISLNLRRIYRFHVDTLNVTLFDSSAYGMPIRGLDVRGTGANKTLIVTGDSSVFRTVIGTQPFNTVPPTRIVAAPPTINGRRIFLWDAKLGEDNALYVSTRSDTVAYPRGVAKYNLATGALPKLLSDTVWFSRFPDGDPVTLGLDNGATTAATDDILYLNFRQGATSPSGIYAYSNLTAATPTRTTAWLDPDNNCSLARASIAVDPVGNVSYFENSNEQVVLVSPPSGANSNTYLSFSPVSIATGGIAPVLMTIGEARLDADGNRRPDKLGDTVKVIGVINSVNIQTTNVGYFLQDANAGIQLFRSGLGTGPTLRPGYRVQVTGRIDYFRGSTEIIPPTLAAPDLVVLDTGNVITPIPLTITQYMANPELYESRQLLISVVNPFNFTSAQWPAAGSDANLTVWDGRDTTIMRIDLDTEIDGSPYPTFPVRLKGTATQFTTASTNDTTGYQISPMFIADFTPINAPPITNFRLVTPTNGSAIVIDTAASYNFTWRRSVDFNGDPITYQFKPVAFAGLPANNGGADSVRTVSGAQLATYLGTNETSNFRWTVLALSTGNPAVSSRDTLSVTLVRRSTPPPAGWTAQTSGVSTYLYSVKAVGPGVAWAAGANGVVLRTTNGGANWTSVGGGNIGANAIYSIEALSPTIAFVTTTPANSTYIFRTTNGGTNWDTVFTQTSTGDAFIDAIKMFDANNGIALGDPVGGKWTIARTTNGGSSWARIATEPAQVGGETGTQNGLSTVGSTHIWFNSGVGGRIYRSTNGGATWTSGTAPAGVTATSNVWFNDTQYGIATSSGSNAVFRSTNGGATWNSVTVAGTGFLIACGGAGVKDFWYARGTTIYRSTDFGATFASAYVGTGSYVGLSFLAYPPNTSGWAVTSTGGIAAFSGALTTGVGELIPGTIPETFSLAQNFPNPFNPTTTIRYAIPRDAFVSMRVYNILGQEIATLFNEVQNAGTFDIVWNGRNNFGNQVASGMYLYRIEAKPLDGGQPFTSLKKMILVK